MLTATLVAAACASASPGAISYLDRILAGVTSQDVGDFVPIPRYDDYQAMLNVALAQGRAARRRLPRLRRSPAAHDPVAAIRRRCAARTTTPASIAASSRYTRLLRRRRERRDHAVVRLRHVDVGDQVRRRCRRRPRPTRGATACARSYRRELARIGDAVGRPRPAGHGDARRARSGSLDIPPREGDIFVFGQPPGDDVNADAWHTHIARRRRRTCSPRSASGQLTIVPGLRVDGFLLEGSAITPPVVGVTPIGFSRLDWARRSAPVGRPASRIKRLTLDAPRSASITRRPSRRPVARCSAIRTLGLSSALHVSPAARSRSPAR